MSFALQINIERDTATPLLQRLAFIALGEKVNRAAAQGVVAMLERHFRALDASRSGRQFGGTNASHFYAKVARTIHAEASATEASVGIGNEETRGIRQRYFGGTITPKNTKWLTIPARPEAYGHRAKEFGFLIAIFGDNLGAGAGALVARQDTQIAKMSGKNKGKMRGVKMLVGDDKKKYIAESGTQGEGGVWYWLVKSVTQDPDPSVLPSNDWIADAAREAVGGWMKRVLTTARIRGELEDLESESE